MAVSAKKIFIFVLIYALAYVVYSLDVRAQIPTSQTKAATNSSTSSATTKTVTPPPITSADATVQKSKTTFRRIYAIFETSMGTFKARLFHSQAPRTVENFIGLAEGTKPWRDPVSKDYRPKPLYENLKFHRVRKGFLIQTGDPYLDYPGKNELGFTLDDEFRPELTHSKAGILSMANRYPAKNTNGSQFFITLKDLSGPDGLDGKNPVFGEVIEGLDVVMRIGSVPINRLNERPLTDIILKSVKIIRE